MLVGVISDTHDRLPTFRRALEMFKRLDVGAVFHAGDFVAPFAARLIASDQLTVPVHCVYGNNDGERAGLKKMLPQLQDGTLRVELAGRRIAMHHFVDWFDKADHDWAEVLISGHNHEASIDHRNDRLYLNPGECCGWVTDRCTVATLDLATLEAKLIDVHE